MTEVTEDFFQNNNTQARLTERFPLLISTIWSLTV